MKYLTHGYIVHKCVFYLEMKIEEVFGISVLISVLERLMLGYILT